MNDRSHTNLHARLEADRKVPRAERILRQLENEHDSRELYEMNGRACASKQVRYFRQAQAWRIKA